MSKLLGKLPEGDIDGLSRMGRQALESPGKLVWAVVALSVRSIENRMDTGDVTVRFGVEAVEAVEGPVADQAEAMLRQGFERRTGKVEMDFGEL